MTTSGGSSASSRRSTREQSTLELLQEVRDEMRVLLREELQNAREELAGTAQTAGRAAGLVGVAGGLGVLATGMSAVAVLRTLDRFLPPVSSAVVATVLYAAGGVTAARVGIAELRRAGPLVPQRTLESLGADVDAVVEGVTKAGSQRAAE
jgi:hypothetical protein